MYPSFIYYTTGSYKWRITVDSGNVIRLKLYNCILKRDSRIQVYDGFDSASVALANIETDDIPTDTMLSSSNIVLVEFEVNTFSESRFLFEWTMVPRLDPNRPRNKTNTLNCTINSINTVNTTDVIKLTSPGWPNGYNHSQSCVWTFLPGEIGYHVALSFITIDMEATQDCYADFVRISTSADLMQWNHSTRLCDMGSTTRRDRFRGTPNLRVTFSSDFTNNRTGFESQVMLDCGGILDQPEGQLNDNMTKRQGNFSLYALNETCTWFINVRRGRTIQFTFNSLDLQKNPDGSCNSHIIIRNGAHEDSPFLGDGKFCGSLSDVNSIPKTSSNKAIVQFVRTRILHRRVFVLKYKQIEHDCGGSLMLDDTTNSTIITTPNYPNIPSAFIECLWRVTAPNGELLKIEFLERFDLSGSVNCMSEYLEIREGSTSGAPVLGRYCGVEIPQTIYTASNMARFQYYTDVAVPKNGFKLKVSITRCGRSISANKGFITSSGYPGKGKFFEFFVKSLWTRFNFFSVSGAYPMQTQCDYHINGRPGSVLNISFLDLDLPTSNNCSDVDHIDFYSMTKGANGNSSLSLIATVCGDSIPEPIISPSSKVVAQFITKSQNNLYRGFRFSFNSSLDTCGSRIEASTGIIQSPNYPVAQETSRFCEWQIQVPKGHRIKVNILDFDLRPGPVLILVSQTRTQQHVVRHSDQRISFYNDFTLTSRIKTVLGANDTEEPIYSTDNTMVIHAILRSNVAHRGFKLRFTSDEPTICEGNFDDDEGSFQNPRNISSYYCEYMRTSHRPFFDEQPNRGTLSIKIIDETVYNSTACITGILTGIAATFFGRERRIIYSKCPRKYENIATPFASTKLAVRASPLQSQYRFPYKVHNCGGEISSNYALIITQPVFEANYGELDCAWKYTSGSDQSIQLTITTSQFDCNKEYINIYNGQSSAHPRITRICGDAKNQSQSINSKNAFIEYHADSYNPSLGFQIQIVTADGVCGGTLEPPNYIFSSPRNGTKYPANTECEWILRSQPGFHVGLYFTKRFMIEQSTNCNKDYIEAFDKVSDEWKSLGRYCGREMPAFLNSTGREMKVIFHTDRDGDGDGFTATWQENCGGVFKATKQGQFITSPRYPEKYPKNIFCNYSIVADEGLSVNVKFHEFELEETARSCNYDNVTIYKYVLYNSIAPMEKVGTYCWTNSISSFRYLQRIDVVFRTDAWIERRGFKFEYSTDKCGGNISAPTSIGSVRDEIRGTYYPMSTCLWNITAPVGNKIVIRFELLDLEHYTGCSMDFVDIFEGHKTIATKRKARLCGNVTKHAPVVSVSSNKALVQFVTDSSDEAKGFTALIM